MLISLLRTAVAWTVVGLVGGLAYREVTKAFDFTGRTQLALVHTHALVLGVLLPLLLLALVAALPGLGTDRWTRRGIHVLNAGLVLTVGMLAYKGVLQVTGAAHAGSAALAGVSGLGHMLLTAALGLVLVAVGRAVRTVEGGSAQPRSVEPPALTTTG